MFILLAVGIIIQILLPENAYDLAVIDKHRFLARTQSPKIVLVGGSNLALGIDSADIQNELHVPVVNTGVNIGFGLGRILDDISPFLNPGDILLIAPEYHFFISAGLWNGSEAAYNLIFNTGQFRLLWSFYYGLPSGFSKYISEHLYYLIDYLFKKNNNTPNCFTYSRDGFNQYGDFIKHLGMENQPISSVNDLDTLNQTCLNNLSHFIDDFTGRGITVLLSYPCYEEQSFRNSAGFIQELDTAFRAKDSLLVISTPASFCFPANYFFDTAYHLNKEGRFIRTRQLIQDLQTSGLFTHAPRRRAPQREN